MANQKDSAMVTGLAHIGVFVADMDQSITFYSDMLGFECYHQTEITKQEDVIKLAFLRCGTCELELVELPVHAPRKAGVVDHIALSVNDLDGMMAHLKAHGVVFETALPEERPEIFDNGIRCIFLPGPDGERIELNQPN
jgi:lactoylglutathione lyase